MQKVMMWQRYDEPSLEYLRFEAIPDGYQFNGAVVLDLEGAPARVDYHITCSTDWHTRRVEIAQERAGAASSLMLETDTQQRWSQNGKHLDHFSGQQHIDLSITPATNLLAIRSLKLEIGQSQDTSALWVIFPDLRLERLDQRYTRLDAQRYRYEALSIDFETILEVDEDGFIIDYGGLWKAIHRS